MKIACVGGGPSGALFRDLDEVARPGARNRGVRAQPAGSHLRLGRGLLRSDRRKHTGNDPVSAAIIPRVRALGRHRRPLPRRDDHLGRARLHRHRPQAPARDPAGPSAGARGRASLRCRMRSGRSQVARLQPRHRLGRHQLGLPRRPPEAFGIDVDVRANKFVWLGTARCSTPSPSPSRRPSTAGSGPTPTASRPTARPSSSSVRRRHGAASASPG